MIWRLSLLCWIMWFEGTDFNWYATKLFNINSCKENVLAWWIFVFKNYLLLRFGYLSMKSCYWNNISSIHYRDILLAISFSLFDFVDLWLEIQALLIQAISVTMHLWHCFHVQLRCYSEALSISSRTCQEHLRMIMAMKEWIVTTI